MASVHHLKEIARVVKTFGNKSSRSLFENSKINSKPTSARQLAIKLAEPLGNKTEWDWAKEILQCGAHARRYVILRSKVKRMLLHRLFHLEIRTGTEYRKAVYQTAKEVFWIRMLLMFGARQVAMWLVPRALERARKFELTEERVTLLKVLRDNATLNGARTEFVHIVDELTEAIALRDAEEGMRAMNDAINVLLVARATPPKAAVDLALASEPKARTLFREHPTFNVGLDYYRIATLAADCCGSYVDLIRLCEESQHFLRKFPQRMTPLAEGQFALKRFRAAVATHRFETARSSIIECERLFPEQNNNWYIWKQTEMLLLLHEEEFVKAAELHQVVLAKDRFSSQPRQVQNRWIFFGLYVTFALWHEDQSTPLPRQQFARALEEAPEYSHDKGGFNASLLILQQLLYAFSGVNGKEEMIEKATALNRYIGRYLRKARHTQVYAFMRMLLLLQTCNFNVDQTERRGRRYMWQFSDFGHEEVDEKQSLPYPLAWQWIAEGVRKNFPECQITLPPLPRRRRRILAPAIA